MMDVQYKKASVFILGAVLLLLLIISKCTSDKYKEESVRYKKNVEALKDTIRYKNNAIGTITASKKAFEVTAKELKKQVWIKDEKINKLTKDFEKLQSVIKTTTAVSIPEINVAYKDSVPFIFERKAQVKNDWYSLNVKSDHKGITLSNLNLENTSYHILGQKRDGLFKKPYWEAEVTNTNPYFKTTNIEIQVIQEKQPFYNKWWFRVTEIGLAAFAGAKAAK